MNWNTQIYHAQSIERQIARDYYGGLTKELHEVNLLACEWVIAIMDLEDARDHRSDVYASKLREELPDDIDTRTGMVALTLNAWDLRVIRIYSRDFAR